MGQRFLFATLLVVVTLSSHAQGKFQRVCDTILYTMVNEKIIIPVKINDTIVNFILDTGGQTGIQYGEAVKLKLKSTGVTRPVGDFSGKAISYGEGTIENIMYGKSYKLGSLKSLIFPDNGFFRDLNVVGILGGDAFAQTVLTIDSKKQVIVINYPYRPDGLKVEEGSVMDSGNTHHSVVTARVGSTDLPILFDTGAQGFLLLSLEDYKKLSANEKFNIVEKGYGIEGVGIGGMNNPIELNKISVPELEFLGKKFRNVESVTSKRGQTIIGVDMIKYGKVVIDYIRNRFYFMPYDTSVEPDSKLPKRWNVSILPNKDGFIVSTIWDEMKGKVEFGEVVTNINGTVLTGVKKSQLVIDDIMDAIDGDTAYLIVLDKNKKERKVNISRK